jgi:LysR family transcriptional regulator, low CO2-responsive transcriptional regulator
MLKNATLRQLSALHAVARLGSVSRAASEIHLTQPAVSIQLKLLEESAGTPLLEREGRGIRLTSAGELMADYAARILDLWREVGDEMAVHRGAVSRRLRIGVVTTAEYLVPRMLVVFARDCPNVEVKLKVGNRDEVVRLLANHEVDLVIMGRPPKELKTRARPFAKHTMAFIASPSHPLMSHRRLALRDLAGEDLLVRERGSGTRTTLEQLFKEADLGLRIGSELSSNEAIKQMCAAGFGLAFMSQHICRHELESGELALLPVVGNPIEREWFVIHLATRRLTGVGTAFEQFLIDHGQQHIQDQLMRTPDTASPLKARAAGSRAAT